MLKICMRTNRLQFRCFVWFLMFVSDDFDSQAYGHAQTLGQIYFAYNL